MTPTAEKILVLEDVSKHFSTPTGLITILDSLSLVVHKGEKVAIIGPSGSGKSTLLSLLGLLDIPSGGRVLLDGADTTALSQNELARYRNEQIGFVFQNFELITPFSVRENVTAPLEIAGTKVEPTFVDNLIAEVGLSERTHAMPGTLSGGEKQRVAIARALSNQPSLILADEPTGSLDRETGERVLSLLLQAVDEHGKTLVVITHDPAVAARMDRVYEIRDKQLHERK